MTKPYALMEIPSESAPATVKQIYDDYARRREGLLKALTADVDDFYQQCDPERENLCLYGHSDGNWSVDTPAEEVPPELPEPCLGINFARDGMVKKDWVALVAVHSDAWLIGLAYYYGILLDKDERETLFKRINSLPTLFEEISGRAGASKGPGASTSSKKQKKEQHEGLHPPRGRSLAAPDVGPGLKGRKAELYWPDDGGWYAVEIMKVNTKSRNATIQYATGEQEELDLDEIIKAGHMALLN